MSTTDVSTVTYVKVVHSNQQNIAGAIQGLLGVHNLLPGGVLQVYCLSPHLHREEALCNAVSQTRKRTQTVTVLKCPLKVEIMVCLFGSSLTAETTNFLRKSTRVAGPRHLCRVCAAGKV